MPAYRRFEKKIIDELIDATGIKFPRRNILVWSVSKSWIESLASENERVVFLKNLEVWCLVRAGGHFVKQMRSQTLNNPRSQEAA